MSSDSQDIPRLSQELEELTVKFEQAEAWMAQVAGRLERIEVLLFRTPVADFLRIDEFINSSANNSGGDTESILKASKLSLTAEAPMLFSQEDSPSLSGMDRSFTLGLSSSLSSRTCNAFAKRSADFTSTISTCSSLHGSSYILAQLESQTSRKMWPTLDDTLARDSSSIHSEGATDFLFPAGQCRQSQTPSLAPTVCQEQAHRVEDSSSGEDCEEHSFPNVFPWTARPSTTDPSWTEPVPRDLELSQRLDAAMASSSSVSGLGRSSVIDSINMASSARTPSPDRDHTGVDSSIDSRGFVFAHLIADNAKLHAELQAQRDVHATIASCVAARSAGDIAKSGNREIAPSSPQAKTKQRKLSKKERERRLKRNPLEM